MPGCAVANCNNNERNSKGEGVTFHRFPKNEVLRKAWIHACKRADTFNVENVKLCSVHFDQDDFERDFKSELLNIKPKRQLKSGAIPKFKIPTVQNTPINYERAARVQKREQSKTLEGLFDISEEPELDKSALNDHNSESVGLNCAFRNESSTSSCALLNPDIVTNDVIAKENEILKNENSLLKEQLKSVLEDLASVKNKTNLLENQVSKFTNIFSANQVQVIQKGSCSNWSSEDISKAVTLRCISKKSFDYVRHHLKYPLPSERTIKRRLSTIEISPGFINISLDLLKSHIKVFTEAEKDVILSYDEMKIKSDLCYDKVGDIIRGPHNYVQVLVIRSLMGKWKQPVFYDFDRGMDKDLFYEVVNIVEKTGFKVRGFVGDMGPKNQKLLSDLGISMNQTSIQNPADTHRRIWGFCDIPHMLKLMRNHLLDEGYKLGDGKIVKKDVLERLVSEQNSDLKFAHKVTPNHFLVQGTERQNVRKAAELLSGTMALAVGYLCKDQEHVQNFLQTINDGFDVMNARIPKHFNKLKSAYGMHIDEQNAALTKLQDLVSSIRVIGRKNLLPFQKGFLISIKSTKGLYADLNSEGYSYVMTSRCNQDVLESYFSMIRGLGKFYDHPLPTAVSQRIKSLLISKNASSIIRTGNCSNDDEADTLSANLIHNAVREDEENANLSNVSSLSTTDVVSDEEVECEELGLIDSQGIEDDVYDEVQEKENSDLIKMLAGYIAFRVKKSKLVSSFTYGYPTNECSYNQRDWLSTLSKGFLMRPTEEWLNIVEKMEEEFSYYHGYNTVCKEKDVMKNLIDKLKKKYPTVDEFAISCYVRTRTFMRIKSLNKKKDGKRSYGDNISTDAGRKKSKKLSKLQ